MKFLYIVTCAFEEIRKQKFIHVVLIVLIFLCTALFNYISLILRPAYYDLSTLYGFKNKEVQLVAYSGSSFFTYDKYKAISKVDNVRIGWSFMDSVMQGNIQYRTVFCTDLLCENMVLKLEQGKQLSEYDGQYIPVILSYDHPLLKNHTIGSTVPITIYFKGQSTTVDIEIYGILKKGAKYYYGSALNDLDYGDVLQSVDKNIIILPDFKLDDGTYFSKTAESEMINHYWYCEITAEDGSEEYQTAYKELGETCSIYSYKEMIKGAWKSYSEGTSDVTLVAFCLLILTAVGIGSANIYIGNNQIRSFAINFICGAKWTDCLAIDIIRNMSIIIVPTILGAAASYVLLTHEAGDTFSFSFVSLWLIFGFVVILFSISSLPYIIKLRRTEPIMFIRSMNKE